VQLQIAINNSLLKRNLLSRFITGKGVSVPVESFLLVLKSGGTLHAFSDKDLTRAVIICQASV
jgi:hypothetical protein